MHTYTPIDRFSTPAHSPCESGRPSRRRPDDPGAAVVVERRIERADIFTTLVVDHIDLPDGLDRDSIIARHFFGAPPFSGAVAVEPRRAA